MSHAVLSLEALDARVRELTHADDPAAVFRSLLESARLAAPRAAVYLIRQGRLKGWGTVGFPSEAVSRQRGFNPSLAEAGWFGRVADGEDALREPQAGGLCPDFGQPAAMECVGNPIRVRGRTIALIVIERAAGEAPWEPSALDILVRVAAMRLDLDLLRRRSASTAAAEGDAPPAEPLPFPRAVAAPAPVRDLPAALSPASAAAAAADDDPRFDAARRYAKLLATDIRLYNEEAVMSGRRQGDLAERLRDHLKRGKETFAKRHGNLGPPGFGLLLEAYVQVLAGGDPALIPDTILD